MKIVEYTNTSNLVVKFLDWKGFEKRTTYQNFKRGQIQNPYEKTVWGVGYIGDGKYKVYDNWKPTLNYGCWSNVLRRCCDQRYKEMFPEYADCICCEEWFNLQTFSAWFEENYYPIKNERVQLDKDILVKGNRTYSPSTCIFVPQSVNLIFQKKSRKENLPTGITQNSKGFRATYNTRKLGKFETLEDAEAAYDTAKREHIDELAEHYKPMIPQKVYDALINW